MYIETGFHLAERIPETAISRDLLALLGGAASTTQDAPDHLEGYKWALDQIADIVCTDAEGTITYVNSQFCRINRCTKQDALGQNNRIFSSSLHPKSFYRRMWRTMKQGRVWRGELCNRALDGTLYWVDTTIAPRFCELGTIVGFIALRTDITARKFAEDRLRRERRRRRETEILFKDIVESLPNGVVVHDKLGSRIFRNRAYRGLDCRGGRDIERSADAHGTAPLEGVRSEVRQLSNGMWLQLDERRSRSGRLVSVQTDVTALKTIEQQLIHQTETDSLTGLKNRAAFMSRLKAVVEADTHKSPAALMLVDLNGFKAINDGMGHCAGDELLVQVALVLKNTVRATDIVGRLGGDEFAVLVHDAIDDRGVRQIAERLTRALCRPVRVGRHAISPAAAVGVATFPQDARTAQTLMRCADLALYQAKRKRGTSFAIFDRDLRRQKVRREILGRKLHEALQRREVHVALQPQYRLADNRRIGFEALVRWKPGRLPVAPPDIIAIAEEENLVEPLSRKIIDEAFGSIAQLRAAGIETGTVAVNVVAPQLLNPRFPSELKSSLKKHGLTMNDVEIEVTENVILDRSAEKISAVLQSIQAMGATIALDDFGTGYASLTHLKRLSLKRIKIDRSFIAGLPAREEDTVIVRCMISLAHSLGFEVVAEGVETEDQLRVLREMGCDAVQGFLTGRPMAASEYIRAHDCSALLPEKWG